MRWTSLALLLAGALLTAAPPARAQSPDTVDAARRPLKVPTVAGVLGVVPGAGHVYAGEWPRGVGLYLLTVGGLGVGAATYVLDRCTFDESGHCDPGPAWPHQALGVALIAVGAGAWVYSVVDAPRAARRTNARRAADAARSRHALGDVAPLVGYDRDARWRVGVTLGL